MEYARRIRWGNVGLLGIVAVLVAAAPGVLARSRPSAPQSRPAPAAVERPRPHRLHHVRRTAQRRRPHRHRLRRHKAPRATVAPAPARPVSAPPPAAPPPPGGGEFAP